MSRSAPIHPTLDDWIRRDTVAFSVEFPETFNAAVDEVIALLGGYVELLGLGEALHGGEGILMLRNRLFQRLAEVHGYSAIALESSFPRARLVNEYIQGRVPTSYEDVAEAGFSHGFGMLEANRELVEWMKEYNANPSHRVKLRLYGFDGPTEMTHTDSPSQVLRFVLDYLASIDSTSGREHRERIDALIGRDADWENPAAMMDPTKSVGLSPEATALRSEIEDLISELQLRRPELVAKSDEGPYQEAVWYAVIARQLLNYHTALASRSGDEAKRISRGLGLRDLMMAGNLAYAVEQERCRGKVFAFAHNSHLQRGKAYWQLSAWTLEWWPAGAQISEMLGSRYAVIGTAVGVSDANGIGAPEAGTLEARLTAAPGPARFIPTHKGRSLPAPEIAGLPVRSGSIKNQTYFPLTPQSLKHFDYLAVLDSTAYSRGGPPLLQ